MEADQKKLHTFLKFKEESLNKKDLSLKGSIDEPIRNLVDIINCNKYYYSTSTCSGRITLIEKPFGKSGVKKGNSFHLNSHEVVSIDKFKSVIKSFLETSNDGIDESNNCLWLKFEPFILHIQCYNLEKARQLLNIALMNGCRNSGISLGKPEKFMVAIRSTSSMEVPIACDTRFKTNDDYMEFLCEESNRRLSDNLVKLTKIQEAIKTGLIQT